ncbi:MAG: TM2 domain-containing protein [Bacteroidales bacterium]
MKKVSIVFIFGVLIALLLQTSCSIEKRHYRSGFYVEHSSIKNVKAKQVEKPASTNVAMSSNLIENVRTTSTETKTQPLFHQSAEERLMNVSEPVFAHKTTKVATNAKLDAKLLNKSEAIKALKENSKAFAFFAQSHNNSKKAGKDQVVALLLCFFLGMLGIHSFYLGNTTKGAIQLAMFLVGLLTTFLIIGYVILLALWIWVLIDFIRIIVGDLGPGW